MDGGGSSPPSVPILTLRSSGTVHRRWGPPPGDWQSWGVPTGRHDALFVYGTLMPGHLRWAMLAPHAVDWRPAVVPGTLYDTGNGWPAAVFGLTPTERLVPGWVVWLSAGTLEIVLPDLDEMEGIGSVPDPRVDPYVRIRVPIDAVTEAWSYHATRTRSSWRVIDAWLDQPEE